MRLYMSSHDIYTLVLCVVVYVMFVVLGLVVISIITKQSLRAIRSGIDDDKIKKELNTNEQKRKAGTIFEKIATTFFCAILLLVFLLSLGKILKNVSHSIFSKWID